MKNSIRLIILLVVLNACKKETIAVDYIVFNGQIKNTNDSLLILRNNFYDPIDTLTITTNRFRDTLHLAKGYYFLTHDNKSVQLFIKKGDNLSIEFDNNDFYASMRYSGNGSIENNYLFDKTRLTQALPMRQRSYNFYAKLSEEDFLKQSDSIRQAYTSLLNAYEHLTSDFKWLESISIEIDHAVKVHQFEGQKRMVEENPTFKVSAQYPNPFEGIDLNNPEFLVTYKYKTLVHSYFDKKSMGIVGNNEALDYFIVYQEQLANADLNTEIKDLLGLENAAYGFTYTADLEKYYQTYIGFAKTEKHIRSFNRLYNIKRSEKGKETVGFKFEGLDGSLYTLADFKGKYIYIDIWASWCSPCLKQIPYLKELEKKYSDKINFVSIAWNDNKSNWKEMIKKQHLGGIQLFAENKNDAFFDFFGVPTSGIPRFILLDKEGRIIESIAKQPSEKSLNVQLDLLE